jgi:hypothetical protein
MVFRRISGPLPEEDIGLAALANYYQKMGLTKIYREGAGLQLSEVGAD